MTINKNKQKQQYKSRDTKTSEKRAADVIKKINKHRNDESKEREQNASVTWC